MESAVEGEQQQKREAIVEGEGLQTQDVEVELVVLLVREPGETPLSPPLAAIRSRTFPSLAETQDQALQVQVQAQLPPPSSSSLSTMSSSQTASPLATPDSPPRLFHQPGSEPQQYKDHCDDSCDGRDGCNGERGERQVIAGVTDFAYLAIIE